jgi:hypothetical protein
MSMNRKPRYPIYIPSKGRAFRPLTIQRLTEMGIPFNVVIEPEDEDEYRKVIPRQATLLILPFSNLGQGSIPARNWIWEHAIAQGYQRHWIIDDNIVRFYRMNFNRRVPCWSPAIFAAAEDFTDRFTNVALSGFNNIAFAPDRNPNAAPFDLNTRIYSISLLNNSMPYRWRGRYNEDTDLCLRALKDGWCTVQFNAFLADKVTTMTMKGGNTDTVYATSDHRLEFAESLVRNHPDVAKVAWKFDRWHHEVDYSGFKGNRLIERDGLTPIGRQDEYGMTLTKVQKEAKDAARS